MLHEQSVMRIPWSRLTAWPIAQRDAELHVRHGTSHSDSEIVG